MSIKLTFQQRQNITSFPHCTLQGSAGVSRDENDSSEAVSSSEEDDHLPGEVDEDSSIDTSVAFSDEEATGASDSASEGK